MPGIDFSTPLLGAGAQAKNEWASASARTSLTFTGAAQFRRGINVEIGVEALATADAAFQQFLAASIRGNAFAKAHAKLQLQLPLNLFAEAGLAVGAEAAAQAAAGLEAGLGLSVGDFVQLAKADPASAGLPLYLLLILLEEVSLGGKFEVHVAAAAMAYASLKITGTLDDTLASKRPNDSNLILLFLNSSLIDGKGDEDFILTPEHIVYLDRVEPAGKVHGEDSAVFSLYTWGKQLSDLFEIEHFMDGVNGYILGRRTY